jgi:glycosyltransferase involved in cell wall biosynthesis
MPRVPRVLAVVTFHPWPVRSGITRRLDALIRALVDASDLQLVVADEPGAPADVPPSLASVPLQRLERTRSHGATLRELVVGLPSGRTLTAAFYRRETVRGAVREVIMSHDPHVLFTHGLGGAALCQGLIPPDRIVLDADTIDPQTYRRLAADIRGPRSWQWRIDVPLVTRWHRRELASYGGVTVVSPADVATYAKLAPDARVILVPNGVDLPAQPRTDPAGSVLLFIGDLTYPPNREGLTWFVREVLPELDASLRIVGGGQVPPGPRVEAVGFVSDLAKEWAGATICVVPLRSGGGTRLKVLEAFAHGVPVVSTEVGVEGVGAVPGVHYLRAETAEEFARVTRVLLSDAAARDRLTAAARDLVAAFTWQRATAPLVKLVQSL